MKKWIVNTGKFLLDNLPGKRYIVFESEPDFSDNTMPVFEEMLRRGYGKKYRLVWWVKDEHGDLPDYPGTIYLDCRSRRSRLRFRWCTMRAKCLISCNKFMTRPHSAVVSFFLSHGGPLKACPGYRVPAGIDYFLAYSQGLLHAEIPCEGGASTRRFTLGFPRNDVLTEPPMDLHSCLEGDFRKVLVWYPTYRQHKNGAKTASVNALPILHDAEKARQLNECARENGVLIVVKPHFAQDVSYIRREQLSNIRFIDDSFFKTHGITSYRFVGSCDGLITDYSSIYHDYLLCRKPIAVVWEDIDQYRQNPGFSVDPEKCMAGAWKIYTLEDFRSFVRSVAAGEDPGLPLREQFLPTAHDYTDGKNTERVVDFITEKAGL